MPAPVQQPRSILPHALLRLRPWPATLAGRTALLLLIGLAIVQALGLLIHAMDRIGLQHLEQARGTGLRIASLYRNIAHASPEEREALVQQIDPGAHIAATVDPDPMPIDPAAPPFPFERMVRENMRLVPIPPALHPREIVMRGDPAHERLLVAMRLPDDQWLNIRLHMAPPRPWHSRTFLTAFIVMTVTAALLIGWAVRRLIAPIRTLSEAADALGRDVNAPALPETGPLEIAAAAAAFNRMADRIRRFVQDRTLLLAAIGHDLRTPITRLKLRAEFLDDDEQRDKFLADLHELETMVSATLAFGRDTASGEPVASLDLPSLLRTILDETGDAWPDCAERLGYEGPDHLVIRARPVALKRALSNLVTNAVKYGDGAAMVLSRTDTAQCCIVIEDNGPGIPPDQLGQVFEPFFRVEASRNRETGGTGLGLPIARNILRGHGGDVTLANRPEGGLRTTVTLPV